MSLEWLKKKNRNRKKEKAEKGPLSKHSLPETDDQAAPTKELLHALPLHASQVNRLQGRGSVWKIPIIGCCAYQKPDRPAGSEVPLLLIILSAAMSWSTPIRQSHTNNTMNFPSKRVHGYRDIPSGVRFEYRPRSGSLPCVKMVQSADLGNFHHPANPRRLDRSAGWCIFVEREMRSKVFVVVEVRFQDAPQTGGWRI